MMTPDNIDKEIHELREKLNRLQAAKRRALKPKVKSTRGRGRPPIAAQRLAVAKELAKDFPIPQVALVTGISLRSLYVHGIKRYRLDAEAAAAVN